LSAAWGRIFFVYGPFEQQQRLVPSVIKSLLKGEAARCSTGTQIRDFLHVADVAEAFVALLESDVTGPVNVASGRPAALQDVIGVIAARFDRPDLIHWGAIPAAPDEPPLLVADTRRLTHEVGWSPRYNLESGLRQTIEWWQARFKETDGA
jgi:nucleoside-diphosphate-sugar epimerase